MAIPLLSNLSAGGYTSPIEPLSKWLYLSAGDCTSTIEPLSRWLHLYYRTSQKVAIPLQVAILRLSNFSAGGYTSPNQTCQQVAIPLISTRGYTSPMKPVSRWLYLSYQHVAIPLLSNLPAGGFTSPMEPLSTWLYLAYLTYQQVAIPRLSNLSAGGYTSPIEPIDNLTLRHYT